VARLPEQLPHERHETASHRRSADGGDGVPDVAIPHIAIPAVAVPGVAVPGVVELTAFVRAHPRLLALTGAGVSTASGIPGYRDGDGRWVRASPMTHQDFVGSESARRRYWGRSFAGWPLLRDAAPNAAHRALAALERAGIVRHTVTQNVDGLHQRAGSTQVIDLNGRIDSVVCLSCDQRLERAHMQALLGAANPRFDPCASVAPDGDADVAAGFDAFVVPPCVACGGVLKPDVVFFGANVPRMRVDDALSALAACDALLVVGTSLMAWSGYRFCLQARASGKPIAAVNLGVTRADDLLAHRATKDCGAVLLALAAALS
jgi:NAD-dependent SIR2 family protein deacetylase